MVSIGLVGCGRWGSLILRDLKALGCEVDVVARSEASRKNAVAGGAVRIHGNIQDLRNNSDVEGAVVATTAAQHHPVVMELLDTLGAYIPVFCEKPLATSLKHAEEMAEGGERLFVMDKWRYHPAIRRMAAARESGEFGALIGLHARRVQGGNPHPDIAPAWTYLPHDLAIIMDVMGRIPMTAHARSSAGNETVRAFLGNRPWATVEFSVESDVKSRELTAYFTGATLSMTDPLSDILRVRLPDGSSSTLSVPGEMPLLAELRAFVAYIGGGPAPRSTAEDGVRVVEAVEEILSMAGA